MFQKSHSDNAPERRRVIVLSDDLGALDLKITELRSKSALRPLQTCIHFISWPPWAYDAFILFIWVEVIIKFVIISNIEEFFSFIKAFWRLKMFAFFVQNWLAIIQRRVRYLMRGVNRVWLQRECRWKDGFVAKVIEWVCLWTEQCGIGVVKLAAFGKLSSWWLLEVLAGTQEYVQKGILNEVWAVWWACGIVSWTGSLRPALWARHNLSHDLCWLSLGVTILILSKCNFRKWNSNGLGGLLRRIVNVVVGHFWLKLLVNWEHLEILKVNCR